MRLLPTIFYFLIAVPFTLLPTVSALGAITATPTAGPITLTPNSTPITTETYNESTQLLYNGVISATATGGTAPYTYTLTGPTFSTQPQNNPYFPWLGPGAYSLLVTDATGQTASVPLTISFAYPQPTLTVSSIVQPSLCSRSDGSFALTGASGTPPYSYSIDGGNTFTPSTSFPNLCGGIYYALVKDSKGQLCIIGSNPTAAMGGLVNLSAPSCAIRTNLAVGATTCVNTGSMLISVYSSSPPVQFSLDGTNFWTLTPNLFLPGVYTYDTTNSLVPGTYNTVATDAAGNLNLFSVSIEKECYPILDIKVSDATCGHNDGVIAITPSYSSPPYSWTMDGVHYQGSPGFSGLAAGYYDILAMDGNGQTDNVTVFVGGLCFAATATVNNSTCEDRSGSITAGTNGRGSTPPYSYSIDGRNFQSSSFFPGLAAGNYTVTIRDGSAPALTATTTTMIGIDTNLTVDAGKDLTICQGGSARLGATSNGTTLIWSPATGLNDTTTLDPTASPTATTKYFLTATLGVCHLTDSVMVNITPPPKVFPGNDTAVLTGQPFPLYAIDINHSGFDSYSWLPVTGLSDPSVANPIATLQQSTTYTVLASTPAGCGASASVSIKTYGRSGIFVPNAFTPNGDGHNDILRALPLGLKTFRNFSIYARSGQRVFFTSNASEGWDGTLNGRPQPTGVYIWIANGTDLNGHPFESNGAVTLIR